MERPKKGRYRHYKGAVYEVIDTVKHSETEEELVLYKNIDRPQLWVRPLEMFMESVEISGESLPRFAYLG